jgi:hypothetical protein
MESQVADKVVDYIKEAFYGPYLEGLKGRY